jgi:hypothetical protein
MEESRPEEERSSGAAIEKLRLGDSSFLLSYIKSGMLIVPNKFRKQKPFFRFLRRSVTNVSFLETINAFRDSILRSTIHLQNQPGGLIFALSGVNGGEGSGFLSFMLALSMGACTTRRVAYFDGRFNSQRFEALSAAFGLSENLFISHKGNTKILGYYKIAQPNVYFLRTVGTEKSLEFFSDKRLGGFLADLRQNFDFIIIGMPPFLKESSSAYLASGSDRLYLVAESGETRRADLQKCVEMACQAGVEISGVVINKQKSPLWSYLFWKDYFFSPRSAVPAPTALMRVKVEDDDRE